MNKQFVIGIIVCLSVLSLASAYETNFSTTPGTSSSMLELTQLKYEPFPVNPGEYFDLWVKAQWTGTGSPTDATFELVPEYPFSLDSNEKAVKSFGKINNEPIVMKYKVRVDKDAVEGVNGLKLKYNSNGYNEYWTVKTFDIQVADAQTDFDLVIQESTGTDSSIAIANIGKNTANSLIVRIPEQEAFRVSGTNGRMVGNLDSGDYTIVSFTLSPTSRSSDGTLKVQLDYTDNIGERRSVVKDVQFISSSPVLNFTRTSGSFQRSGLPVQQTSTSIFKSVWFWVVVILLVGLWYYRRKNPEKFRQVVNKLSNSGHEKKEKDSPDWVASERTKRR